MLSPMHGALCGALLAGCASLVPAASVAAADSVYARAVATAGRSDQDRERDVREHPAEVLAFAGFAPGMRIADVFGGGGYYSELLSYLVGPAGRVLLVNDAGYADFAAEGLATRFK